MGREHLQNPDVSCGHEPLLVSPHPALSPQGGERVAAGRERGMVHGKRETRSAVFHAEHLLAEGRGTHLDTSTLQASRKYFPLPTTKEQGEGQGEGNPMINSSVLTAPSPRPSPRSSLAGRGIAALPWWQCQDASEGPLSVLAGLTVQTLTNEVCSPP